MSVSLRSVAKAAGVSVSTASCALRGLAKVDAATRSRVCAVAGRMGYIRNPQLSHALSYVRRRQRPDYRETLAVLINYSAQALDGPGMKWAREMHGVILQRGAELGYKVEFVKVSGRPGSHRALSRQLHAQGIRGLLIMPGLGSAPYVLDVDFSKFACVEIGQTLNQSHLPRVVRDITNDYLRLFHELHQRGYRRIGLAICEHEDRRRQWAILASYLVCLDRNPDLPRLPRLPRDDEKVFVKWLKKVRPDVIVVNGSQTAQWLRNAEPGIAQGIGLCRIDTLPGEESGLSPCYASMARSAVNILTSSLERGEIGIPTDPPLLYIPSHWHEGGTLRPRCQLAAGLP